MADAVIASIPHPEPAPQVFHEQPHLVRQVPLALYDGVDVQPFRAVFRHHDLQGAGAQGAFHHVARMHGNPVPQAGQAHDGFAQVGLNVPDTCTTCVLLRGSVNVHISSAPFRLWTRQLCCSRSLGVAGAPCACR